jgi:hypothetical protein
MIDVATLRRWLDSPESDDDLLAILEAEAVARVEAHTGRSYGAPAERTDVILGSGTAMLFLPQGGTTITVSLVEEYMYPGAAPTVLAATDYEVRDGRVVRLGGYAWYQGAEYHVTYTAGYTAGAEPPIVREVVRELVSLAYQARGSEGLQSESIADYSYTKSYGAGGGGQTLAEAALARLPRQVLL